MNFQNSSRKFPSLCTKSIFPLSKRSVCVACRCDNRVGQRRRLLHPNFQYILWHNGLSNYTLSLWKDEGDIRGRRKHCTPPVKENWWCNFFLGKSNTGQEGKINCIESTCWFSSSSSLNGNILLVFWCLLLCVLSRKVETEWDYFSVAFFPELIFPWI